MSSIESSSPPPESNLLAIALSVLGPVTAIVASDLLMRALVYGRAGFRSARAEAARLERQRASRDPARVSRSEAARLDKELQDARARASGGFAAFIVPNLLVACVWLACYSALTGAARVGVLPFDPPAFVPGLRSWTHGSIPGADWRDAAFFCFLIPTNIVARYLVSKVAPGLSGAPVGAAVSPIDLFMERWASMRSSMPRSTQP